MYPKIVLVNKMLQTSPFPVAINFTDTDHAQFKVTQSSSVAFGNVTVPEKRRFGCSFYPSIYQLLSRSDSYTQKDTNESAY